MILSSENYDTSFHKMTLRKLIVLLTFSAQSLELGANSVGYNTDVRPILSDKCFLCHGPDKTNNKAGLRLDDEASAYAALKDTPGKHAIVPGSLENSEVWLRINSNDPDEVMPTPESNLVLTDSEKEIIASWIKQGAEYEPHWAFVPLPNKIPVPTANSVDWPRNPIDNFVVAKLQANDLQPSPEADPLRWFRRVCFDLTGLPPTQAQLDTLQSDLKSSPAKAHEKAVDTLLTTIEYAEHMTLDWLDAARYADTWGYHSDMNFTAWPYRDWVVRAYQQDLPYKDFVTWNIAGDLLPDATKDQKLATAFNRFNRMTNEGGSDALEFFVDGVSDRVHTMGTAFLGLTLECSKCHDHKYDPITAKDYYQLFSFFNSINENGLYIHGNISPPPSLLLPTDAQEAELKKRKQRVAAAQKKLAQLDKDLGSKFQEWKANALNPTPSEGGTPPVPRKLSLADLSGHFDFDKDHKQPLESRTPPPPGPVKKDKDNRLIKPKPPSLSLADIHYTEGPKGHGSAIILDGDRGASTGNFFIKDRYTPFSVGLWMKDTLREKRSVVIWQRAHGTEVGYNGIDLRTENGFLTARVFRHWPDNGIGIKTIGQIPKNEWHHITVTYDASSTAKGLAMYKNGLPLETKIVGDKLYKSVNTRTYTAGNFTLGAIFRGPGFKGGHVDELITFDRALTPLEVGHIAGLEDINQSSRKAADKDLYPYYLSNHNTDYRKARDEYAAAQKALVQLEDTFTEVPVMEEMDTPRPAYLLSRGEFTAERTEENKVTRDTPAFLLPFPEGAPRNRLGLAQWLTLPNHPLTTRVYINRIWQQLFGNGLVGTTENFGLQGDLPTHPELLDWLCRDFINHNWSTKHLVKQIALSATYRQDSVLTPELQSLDIANKLLARGPSHRLTGEAIRDAALLTSGLLSDKRGGPPVKPYDPVHNRKGSLDHVHRRSLYSYWRRTKPQNNMIIFDKPSLEVCSVQRSRTSSPAQALVLLNDTQFVETARNLAANMLQKHGDDASRIKAAWKTVTSREATEKELELLTAILAEQRNYFKANPREAEAFLKIGLKPLPKDLDPIESAALTVVCQATYNTDAAVWKR